MSESLRDICLQSIPNLPKIYFPKVRIHFRVQEEQFLEQIFLLMLLLILALRNEVLPLGRRNGGLKTSHRLVTGRLRLDRSNLIA